MYLASSLIIRGYYLLELLFCMILSPNTSQLLVTDRYLGVALCELGL